MNAVKQICVYTCVRSQYSTSFKGRCYSSKCDYKSSHISGYPKSSTNVTDLQASQVDSTHYTSKSRGTEDMFATSTSIGSADTSSAFTTSASTRAANTNPQLHALHQSASTTPTTDTPKSRAHSQQQRAKINTTSRHAAARYTAEAASHYKENTPSTKSRSSKVETPIVDR
ncbi:hypothetical protein M758_UG072700 [Ceratodon purpureus]|nr:hypothetical protein M758_UG072700 [Ceratodon purpureus]